MNIVESPDDAILQEDIESIIVQNDFSLLHNTRVLVTGATGLLGSLIVKTLACMNRLQNAHIQIYAIIRNSEKAQQIFPSLYKSDAVNFIIADLTKQLPSINDIDYIIHGASITSSKAFIETPVETIDTAIMGTRNMLRYANEQSVKGFVYLSSMEVFGVTDNHLAEITESDYGYIDILNPRSSYSESKRLCECLCAAYAQQYHVPVKIARLTQTFGAGLSMSDTRVAAQFSRCVLEGKNIILKTEGKMVRPCVYTADAVAGILYVLLKGKQAQAYTVANKITTCSIKETAEMLVEKIAEGNIHIVFDINVPPEYASNLNVRLHLNTDKLESLGWKARVNLEDAYRRTIESMRNRL